jgi:tetratricopeptide (TPR) repeat protein
MAQDFGQLNDEVLDALSRAGIIGPRAGQTKPGHEPYIFVPDIRGALLSAAGSFLSDEELSRLAGEGAADTALRGEGPVLEAKLMTAAAVETGDTPGSKLRLGHIYSALGMLNWYLERPRIASDQFARAADLYSNSRDAVRSRANQVLSLCQAGEDPPVDKCQVWIATAIGLGDTYTAGLLQYALGEHDEAVVLWKQALVSPRRAEILGVMNVRAPVGVDDSPSETQRLAAEALVSLLVSQMDTKQAAEIWDAHLEDSYPTGTKKPVQHVDVGGDDF